MSFSANDSFRVKTGDTFIGLTVFAAMMLFLAWYVYDEKQQDSTKWLEVYAQSDNTHGVSKDTPIKLSGMIVGRVAEVELLNDANIQFTIELDKQFERFFMQGSSIKLEEGLSLSNVIPGGSLAFLPGQSSIPLKSTDAITFTVPESIAQKIEKLDLEATMLELSSSVSSLNRLLADISSLTPSIKNTAENIEATSQFIVERQPSMARLIQSGEQTVDALNVAITTTQSHVNESAALLNSLIAQSQALLATSETLMQSVKQTTSDIPQLIDSSNYTVTEIGELAEQLQNHWLLRAGQEEKLTGSTPSNVDFIYPSDSELYGRKAIAEELEKDVDKKNDIKINKEP